jgi:hypothetical protein
MAMVLVERHKVHRVVVCDYGGLVVEDYLSAAMADGDGALARFINDVQRQYRPQVFAER